MQKKLISLFFLNLYFVLIWCTKTGNPGHHDVGTTSHQQHQEHAEEVDVDCWFNDEEELNDYWMDRAEFSTIHKMLGNNEQSTANEEIIQENNLPSMHEQNDGNEKKKLKAEIEKLKKRIIGNRECEKSRRDKYSSYLDDLRELCAKIKNKSIADIKSLTIVEALNEITDTIGFVEIQVLEKMHKIENKPLPNFHMNFFVFMQDIKMNNTYNQHTKVTSHLIDEMEKRENTKSKGDKSAGSSSNSNVPLNQNDANVGPMKIGKKRKRKDNIDVDLNKPYDHIQAGKERRTQIQDAENALLAAMPKYIIIKMKSDAEDEYWKWQRNIWNLWLRSIHKWEIIPNNDQLTPIIMLANFLYFIFHMDKDIKSRICSAIKEKIN